LDVASAAETTVLVLVPESGDGIQALKSGLMEVADVFVVNKSDRPGAEKMQRDIEVMLGIRRGNAFRHVAPHHRAARPAPPSEAPLPWEPPVLLTVASKGEGVDAVIAALGRHRTYLESGGRLAQRRRERLAERTRAVVNRALRSWIWEASPAEAILADALDDMTAGKQSPYDVAARIVDHAKSGATR
jgi:LAO/AO transport system kinase